MLEIDFLNVLFLRFIFVSEDFDSSELKNPKGRGNDVLKKRGFSLLPETLFPFFIATNVRHIVTYTNILGKSIFSSHFLDFFEDVILFFIEEISVIYKEQVRGECIDLIFVCCRNAKCFQFLSLNRY